MTSKVKYILFFIVTSMIMLACTKDQLDGDALVCEEPIVYEDVRSVLTSSCGYVGCHNGIDRGENFNNYAGLQSYLSSGGFASRVLESRDMPPSYATGPTELTEVEIDLIKCWEQNEYKEF